MSKELDDLKAKTKVPVLSGVRVASPCTVDWATMAPIDSGEQVRHCGSCKKNVYNLSSMTREEAETLLLAKEGRLCVRYFQRTDGTILLKDCMVAPSAAKRRWLAASAAALLATASGAAYLSHGADRTLATTIVSPSSTEDIPDDLRLANGQEAPPPAPIAPEHDTTLTAAPQDFHMLQGDVAMPEELHDIKGEL